MARVTYVKKSQKSWMCEKCGKAIEVGQSYKHVSPRSGPWEHGRKRIRCADCPTWKPSELTFSKMAGVYAAQEDFQGFIAGWSPEDGVVDIESALEEFASNVEQVADEYQESADNIEEGFRYPTGQSEELVEKADSLRNWAEEVRSAYQDIDEDAKGDDLQSSVEDAIGITDECPV